MNAEVGDFFRALGRRWLVVLVVYVIGLALMTLFVKNAATYSASANLLIISEALKDTTMSDPDLPSILTSTEVLGRVIDRLKLDTNPTKLAKKIKTKLPAKSSVLELTYQDRDGVKAAVVTNAIADEAATYFHEIATRGYTDVLEALNGRVAQSQAEITAADKVLQKRSAESQFRSSEKALDSLATQIDGLRVQSEEASTSLAADRATGAAFDKQIRNIDPIVHGEILQKDAYYQQLQTQIARDAADSASERASFNDSFPGLAALEKRVERERNQLKAIETTAVRNGAGSSPSYTQTILEREHATGLINADQERLRVINAQLVAEEKLLREAAMYGVPINTLRAKRDGAIQQYLTLTQRLATAEADAAQGASLGRLVVVSRAIPGPSVLPIAWLFGCNIVVLALAIAAAYVCETLDRRLWGNREIEKVYGLPTFIEIR